MNLKIISLKSFDKDVKRLYKKYRNLAKDLAVPKRDLLTNPAAGVALGNDLYKIRLANSSIPTGKSAGFRVVYYFYNTQHLYLLTIFSKSDLENIDDKQLLKLLDDNLTS
jgi:hypothetical protein